MLIRRPVNTLASAFAVMALIYPTVELVRDKDGIAYVVSALFAVAFVVSTYLALKKREIRYQSTSAGIVVTGSKEGLYDPDYIPFSEMADVTIDRKVIVVSLVNGSVVRLPGLKRRSAEVLADIKHKLEQYRNRPGDS